MGRARHRRSVAVFAASVLGLGMVAATSPAVRAAPAARKDCVGTAADAASTAWYTEAAGRRGARSARNWLDMAPH
jgi:hypothetical protein